MEAVRDWLGRTERALDEFGKPAWIATMVVGFIVFVPIGLAILAYMIWSGRMSCGRYRKGWKRRMSATAPTGNEAFDAYREETLRRLETEREAFTSFLERLRRAKDQAEFDQFMTEQRAGGAAQGGGGTGPAPSVDRPTGPAGPFGGAEPYPA
jgi:hypothetical protein